MLLQCHTNKYEYERFYLSEYDNIDELKNFAENNMPIKCYKIKQYRKSSIVINNDLKEIYLYLNNYLYYKDVSEDYHFYIFTREQFDKLTKNQCLKCFNYERSYGRYCSYISKNNLECLNFEENINLSLWKIIKKILKSN